MLLRIYSSIIISYETMAFSPSPCTSEVHSVKLSRSNCMISVESLQLSSLSVSSSAIALSKASFANLSAEGTKSNTFTQAKETDDYIYTAYFRYLYNMKCYCGQSLFDTVKICSSAESVTSVLPVRNGSKTSGFSNNVRQRGDNLQIYFHVRFE